MHKSLRCVLIIGDGFSRSLVHHVGLQNRIVTRPLFPPPIEVPWEPDPEFGDGQPNCRSLGDPNLFPYLWKAWDEFIQLEAGSNSKTASNLEWRFLKYISEKWRINPTFDQRVFSYATNTPSSQLRAYLFYLFRHYYDILELSTTSEQWRTWNWINPLAFLNDVMITTYISFNYDLVLETALHKTLGFGLFFPISEWDIAEPDKPGICRIVKPHGSIAFDLFAIKVGPPIGHSKMIMTEGNVPNVIEVRIPPAKHPGIFDIVPPGHALPHRINPYFRLEDEISQHLTNADIIVLCGLSAEEPDTTEINSYLSRIKPRTPAIHIGLPGDQSNPAGKILRKFSGKHYVFVEAGSKEFNRFPSIIINSLRKVGKVK